MKLTSELIGHVYDVRGYGRSMLGGRRDEGQVDGEDGSAETVVPNPTNSRMQASHESSMLEIA
jgi:hypothetical protein